MNEEPRPARNRLSLKWLRAFAAFAAMAAMGNAAQASWQQPRSVPAPGWTEYSFGQSGNIGVLLRVKDQVSVADSDWLQVEITNDGPESTIAVDSISGVSPAAESSGERLSGIKVGRPGGMDRGRAVFTLPTGKLIMFEPGVRMAASLGQVAAGEKVSVRIKVGLRLADGRVFEGSASASATWINPDAVQLAAAQKEMFELLSKDTAGPGQRLSPSQSERLGLLIGNSDVSSVLTVEQALAAIRVYQQERRLRNFANPENAVGHILMLVNKRWSRDPATITFYRDALTTRSDAAISDFQVLRDVWDDSFVEPLLKAFEAGMLGMDLLGRHYSSWAKDATIPPRLSKAVLAHHPSLSRNATGAGASSADPRYALGLLGQTHDPTMIPLLRPFLADKTPTSAIAVPQRTPLRISEFASNAILWLLGEPERYRGAESGIGPSAYPGPQPPLGRMGQGDCGVGETPRRPAQASRVMKSIHSF